METKYWIFKDKIADKKLERRVIELICYLCKNITLLQDAESTGFLWNKKDRFKVEPTEPRFVEMLSSLSSQKIKDFVSDTPLVDTDVDIKKFHYFEFIIDEFVRTKLTSSGLFWDYTSKEWNGLILPIFTRSEKIICTINGSNIEFRLSKDDERKMKYDFPELYKLVET
jgi:hypothetical protein